MHKEQLPQGYCGITTTRSPFLTNKELSISTTTPAASCPRQNEGTPSLNALYSVHIGVVWIFTTTYSFFALGEDTSIISALASQASVTELKNIKGNITALGNLVILKTMVSDWVALAELYIDTEGSMEPVIQCAANL